MMEVLLLGIACFVVGGLAGVLVTLVMAALVAGSRADDEMERRP
jgi:hypothetical protein